MDRRLSGALAWGALLLIVGIPGFDMLSRSDSGTAGVAAMPEGGDTGLSWQSGSAPIDTDPNTSAFGPLPQDVAEASDAGENDSLPSVTLLASAPDGTASETPPAAPSPSIITIDDTFAPAEPTELGTLDIDAVIADVTTEVATGADATEPAPEPEPTTTASADTVSSAIAARVRDVLFSSPDTVVAPDAAATSDASTDIGLRTASRPVGDHADAAPDDDLSAVATAPLTFSTPVSVAPETIPYPAPALRRLSPPVARTTLVPPEPVPEIRPDNAIFFGDWVNTPPTSTATGPGR